MSKTNSCVTSGNKENESLSPDQTGNLLQTKLFIPPIRLNQINRPRLSNLLDTSFNYALILVSAPAGYGKTTLVSSWLQEKRIPSAWLSLDDGDNDPIRFLLYLHAALAPFSPGIEDEFHSMLQGIQPALHENAINLLVNELASTSNPFILILDDFHTIHSDAVLRILTYLLDHLPPQMHLVILTRADPPLQLSRMRVRNQLLDIRADQLRFSQDEIASFLNDAMGLTLSTNDLSALEARTEGWIAGLQLAALSMQSCEDVHAFVSAFTGSHHYVMDFLVEEVLKLQPKNVSAFLLQTSFLDRLCGSLCEAVVETDPTDPMDGQTLLEALEEKNLFLIPLDDQKHWYRYHHLFADVLRKRLEHQYPNLLPELHRRASRWYEQNGLIAESIHQSIAASDQDRAAQLIEQNGCFILMTGEVMTLLNWVDAIDYQPESHPWLAIQKAWALALTGNLDRVESTLRVPEELLTPLQPTVEVRTMQGTIAAARAHCANLQGDTLSAAKYARQALDLLPDCSSISQSIRSVATSILGDASWINGNLEEATYAYTEAIRIGREAGNLHMVIIANSNLAEIFVEQGQLHKAADILTRSLQMAIRPDGQKSPLAGKLYAGLSRLAYERNQMNEADQYIQQCIDLCRQWGDIDIQAIAFAILARLKLVLGNPEAAKDAFWEAEQLLGEHLHSPLRSTELKYELARYWLAQGNLEKPSQFIPKSAQVSEDLIPYRRQTEYVILLRVLLARKDYKEAIALSKILLQQAELAGRMGLVIEILILQALAFQEKKDTDQCLVVLERALALANAEGYVRIFLDEGETMTRMLCQVQSRQVGGSYAEELLSKIGKIPNMTQPSMQLLVEPLTTREIEVLKLIKAGCSNQDIAEQLVISLPTVKRHISNIYGKLGVESRTQAVAIGKELKIFD